MNISELLARTMLLDLETTLTGRIRHVGAVLQGRIFERSKESGGVESGNRAGVQDAGAYHPPDGGYPNEPG